MESDKAQERTEVPSWHRKLTVSYLGEKPCIRIVADYLYKFGFEIGDRLEMLISKDTIIINKCHNDTVPDILNTIT